MTLPLISCVIVMHYLISLSLGFFIYDMESIELFLGRVVIGIKQMDGHFVPESTTQQK